MRVYCISRFYYKNKIRWLSRQRYRITCIQSFTASKVLCLPKFSTTIIIFPYRFYLWSSRSDDSTCFSAAANLGFASRADSDCNSNFHPYLRNCYHGKRCPSTCYNIQETIIDTYSFRSFYDYLVQVSRASEILENDIYLLNTTKSCIGSRRDI